MKFRVTGTSHDTGARMTLELDAGSKADAERKAHSVGMDVMHVQDITNGDLPQHERRTHRGEESADGSSSMLKLIIAVVVIGAVVYFAWGMIAGMIG